MHVRRNCLLLPCLALLLLWPSAARAERYAFIVGNNSYPNFSAEQQLSGCESDAQMIRDMLVDRVGIPAENVHMLLGKEATAARIVEGLKTTLQESKPGDSVLFYYSGHGSQIADDNGDEKDDRLDEVLCPYDFKFLSGRRAKNAVVDDQLDEILSTMGESREFVAVFDCCHSGTGLRSLFTQPGRHVKYLSYTDADDPSLAKAEESAEPLTRGMFRNSYVAPPPSDSGRSVSGFLRTRRLAEDLDDEKPAPGERKMADAQKPAGGTVLVAAARDYELAAENTIQVRHGGPSETHGALTVEMCRYIQESPDPKNITYRDLRNYLDHPIVQGNNTQNPQVEVSSSAMLDEAFLSGAKGACVVPKETPAEITSTKPTPTPEPAQSEPTPTSEPTSAPKPEPVVAIQAANVETFPQPIAITLKRCDAFATEQKPVNDLNPEASAAMLKEITAMIGQMRDVATIAAGKDPFGMLVVYGVQDKAAGRAYTAVVVDSNSAQIVKSISGPTLRNVLNDVRAEIERNYLATNLMRIRQPVASKMQLDLNIGLATTISRGMQVSRRRFAMGETVAFEVRPSHNGYLTLLNIDSTGGVTVLYPNDQLKENQDGFVRAGETIHLPAEGQYAFPVEEPVGKECVKAFLTPKPLSGLAGLVAAAQKSGDDSAGSNAGGVASRSLNLMRGISGELDRTIGAKSAIRGAKPDWSDLKSANWSENTIIFTTSR
jgi:hypothetical protein